MQPEEKTHRIRFAGLFLRGGLFHAVLVLPLSASPVEIALHGISSLDDALRAVDGFCENVATVPV